MAAHSKQKQIDQCIEQATNRGRQTEISSTFHNIIIMLKQWINLTQPKIEHNYLQGYDSYHNKHGSVAKQMLFHRSNQA